MVTKVQKSLKKVQEIQKHMAAKHAAMGEAQLYEELKDPFPTVKYLLTWTVFLQTFLVVGLN